MNLVLKISPKCGQRGGSKIPKILRTSYMDARAPFAQMDSVRPRAHPQNEPIKRICIYNFGMKAG